jgi:Icc-related predicted phosphoesterase
VASIEELRPTLVFSGHIHDSPFRSGGTWASRLGDTWIFNAGRTSGAPPAVIELDLGQGTAKWVSQAGVESVDLNSAAGPA